MHVACRLMILAALALPCQAASAAQLPPDLPPAEATLSAPDHDAAPLSSLEPPPTTRPHAAIPEPLPLVMMLLGAGALRLRHRMLRDERT